jgi:hypothetical protein
MQKFRNAIAMLYQCHANCLDPNLEIAITRRQAPRSASPYLPLLPCTPIHRHIMYSPSNHPKAAHLALYSQIPHPLILIEIRKDIRTINKTKENPYRKPLQPRINLLNNILPRPSRPLATSLRHSRRQLDLLDLVRVRDRVDVQAAGHVPGYMAVES